ncbi:TasA family protein [Neobacillus niacini]|uniref:TasA family protein n=1 Tax=Neobacillus niacini TaxID=86668 RepID=UPI003983A9D4
MKKKFLALTLGSVVLTAGIIGGTFAYFNDVESSNNNNYSAGTLDITSLRNDLPTVGPMFYTNTTADGLLGTGLWKPGDAHTRGLFMENSGTLNGVLKNISAKPEAAANSQAYADAMEFAKQSVVTISVLEPVSGEGTFDSTTYAEMLKQVNDLYNEKWDLYWGIEAAKEGNLDLFGSLDLAIKVAQNVATDMLGEVFTTTVTDILGNEKQIQGRVADVITEKSLEDVVNSGVNVQNLGFTVTPGEDMYFAYTVKFLNLDPSLNNPLQGKEVKFSFSSEFVQE